MTETICTDTQLKNSMNNKYLNLSNFINNESMIDGSGVYDEEYFTQDVGKTNSIKTCSQTQEKRGPMNII